MGEGFRHLDRQHGRWGQICVDEDLGTGLPAGGTAHRRLLWRPSPGNGLFGESIVAVDLKTGKRKWHYQLVHHGLWDMDIPCAPIWWISRSTARP